MHTSEGEADSVPSRGASKDLSVILGKLFSW